MKNYVNMYEKLSWDTNFFGYGVARITENKLSVETLHVLLHQLKDNHIRLVYWFVDPSDMVSNNAAGFNKGALVDEKLTYVMNVPEIGSYDTNHIFSYLNRPVNKRLLSLVFQSAEYSRFKTDPHFRKDDYEKLYTIWIERSVKKEIAEEVFVFMQEGIEVGFITVGIKNNRGDIGLIAVDHKYRGQSIGKQLINAAFTKVRELGHPNIQVITQKSNSGACNFYQKVGFNQKSIENVYHFWL